MKAKCFSASRVVLAVLTVVALGFGGVSASAAEPTGGNVPPEMLAQFGLGSMEVLSDAQGEEIRGSGFYFHYGHNYLGRYNQFHDVGKLVFFSNRQHGNALAIRKYGFLFQSKFFSHPGYRYFLPVIAAISGGGQHHR